MRYHSLLASALVFTGLTALTSIQSAEAQTSVDFSGTVVSSCTYGTSVNGTLLATDDDSNSFEDAFSTDTDGIVPVTCNNDFSLTLESPSVVSSPTGFDASAYDCTTYASGFNEANISMATSTCDTPTASVVPATLGTAEQVNTGNLNIAMDLNNGPDLPAGNYVFRVNVTASAN